MNILDSCLTCLQFHEKYISNSCTDVQEKFKHLQNDFDLFTEPCNFGVDLNIFYLDWLKIKF
jgi:hypothetical protein